MVEDREQLDQQLRQLQLTRSSNYFPAPGRGGLRQPQSSYRPGRGYSNVGDRGTTANGPSQKSDENGDNTHSDDESSPEEESAFSHEEDNDEEDEEEKEEDKTPEAPATVTTQNNATRGKFRGRGGQRGRTRGRGYRNTGGSNARFSNHGGGRGNYRGSQGRNPRQSYPLSNNTRSNQSNKKAPEKAEDTTIAPSLVDDHEEQLEQEVLQSVSTPKDQRPPRERRTVPQDASNSSVTNYQQEDTPPVKSQPTSVDEAD